MQVSNSLWNVIQQYFENGIILPVFILALIWSVKKWNKKQKIAFAACACGSILVFNELVYRLFMAAGEGSTFYRLFWMVPILLITAAFVVNCILSAEKKQRILILPVCVIAVWLSAPQSGAEWVTLPENIYQIDPDVIQVSDALMELTNQQATYLIDDGSISNTVRQYNAKIMFTDMDVAAMDMILRGNDTNVLGKDAQIAIDNNRSRYIAIKKEDTMIYKVMENAGIKLAKETDHYRIYYVHYKQLIPDVEEIQSLAVGEGGQANIEYIPITGLKKKLEYVYVTDFGEVKNEAAYREAIKAIETIKPDGILINAGLSENEEWSSKYKALLEELDIPYYRNDTRFQVIAEEDVTICMIDNREGVTEETLVSLENLISMGRPIVLVLAEQVSEKDTSGLGKLISEANGVIVQVLSAKQDTFQKNLIGERILQFATPTDRNQLLNIIRIEGLEPEEIITY